MAVLLWRSLKLRGVVAEGLISHPRLQPAVFNLPKGADDLLCTVSFLHGFYGIYTAELSLKTVQFLGVDNSF